MKNALSSADKQAVLISFRLDCCLSLGLLDLSPMRVLSSSDHQKLFSFFFSPVILDLSFLNSFLVTSFERGFKIDEEEEEVTILFSYMKIAEFLPCVFLLSILLYDHISWTDTTCEL